MTDLDAGLPIASVDVAVRLISCYQGLARKGEHILQGLLAGEATRQWQHWPADDAIDATSGYQWFYHSHSPEDRQEGNGDEHGHFHLFARTSACRALPLRLRRGDRLRQLVGYDRSATTRHLLCVSLNAKGLPIELFTVNSWVTGDAMLDAEATGWLLAHLRLATGYPEIDTLLSCTVALCASQVQALLDARDAVLLHTALTESEIFSDRTVEVLSSQRIDIDHVLSAALSQGSSPA